MKRTVLIIMTQFLLVTAFSYGCSEDDNGPSPEESNGEAGNETAWKDYVFGVDLSYVNQVEDHGGVYKTENGEVDPFEFLSDKGANLTRVRLWHSPDWVKDIYGESTPVYSGFQDAAKTIQRAQEAEMASLLDFHYSDRWADPGHQDVPKAWENITDINVLCDSVYNYTYYVLDQLNQKGLLPEMVQIGNETNCGMMMTNVPDDFPSLNVCEGNWNQFGKVVNSAIDAVRDIETDSGDEIKIALHIADPKNLEWWTDDVIHEGNVTDFDVMGFSYYHIWHTEIGFDELPGLVSRVKDRFNKEILVMETAYPFTTANNDNYGNIYSAQHDPIEGFPVSQVGQKDFMITLNQNMIDAGAMGVIYWEPAWISSNMQDLWGTGSSWENCAFFNFSGYPTDVVDYLGHEYDGQ